MITKNENLEFILNKVKEIGYAMFKADIPSELQIPNNIITTLKTEAEGTIWFFTSSNKHYADYMDKHFNATLDYYKKGSDYRLHIDGMASIIETEANAPAGIDGLFNNMMLIKFTIVQAEYFEAKRIAKTSLKERISYFISDLFVPHSHRMFNFSKTA
jgi:hypothetical protein